MSMTVYMHVIILTQTVFIEYKFMVIWKLRHMEGENRKTER